MKSAIHTVAALALTALSSQAAFVLVDDMESGNNWASNGTAPTGGVVADPAGGGNNVYSIVGQADQNADASDAWLSLGTGIANNTTGTLFFRVRVADDAGDFNWVFGSSDVADPGTWGDYEGYGVMDSVNNTVGNEVAVRNGGSFTTFTSASADTWYNVWLVLDNTSDITTMYFGTGDSGTAATQSGTFRNGTTASLDRLFVRNNVLDSTGYIDDVYLDTSGANLANPIPEPSSLALLFCGAASFVVRRRR